MLWLMADQAEAEMVAEAAGLKTEDWTLLTWHHQLSGIREPNIIVLESSLFWERDKFGAIVTAMVESKATRWQEVDLYQGKVPR